MERGPTLAVSFIFGSAMFFLLSRNAALPELHLYILWFLILGPFIAGALIWGFRCGVDQRDRRLLTILYILFSTMSFIMSISAGFVLLLLHSLYLSAYSLLGTIIMWEVVSELAREIP